MRALLILFSVLLVLVFCSWEETAAVTIECPGDMVWYTCHSKCHATCENPEPGCDGCVAMCGCPEATPILHDGHCITLDECPVCRGGQVWTICGTSCYPTCKQPYSPCDDCVDHCQCPLGQFWNEEINQCVTSCPCEGGKVWTICGTSCIATCEEPNPPPCEDCVNHCQCPESAPIWNDNQCVQKCD